MSAQARIAPTSSGQRSRERSTHARRSFTPWARARAAGFRGRARGRLLRRRRGGCHLHGLRRGAVDVGALQERSARRRLERSQDRVRTPVWAEFTTHDGGPLLAGLRAGGGPPVLLLHGGPGLGFGYLRDLADELAQENAVAWYQQRGLEPSAVEGPYSVAADVG